MNRNTAKTETTHESISMDSVQEGAKRRAVVPGEIIQSGDDFLPGEGTRREGSNILASRFGLAEEIGKVIRVIPISGAFIPRRGNVVIGRVTDVTFRGWLVDIDYASQGFLPIEESPRFINRNEMSNFLAIGDILSARVESVTPRGIDLSLAAKGLGKLDGGFIFRIIPSRVPRVIGREGSMVSLIKDKTGCQITVGQNGWVWVRGQTTDSEILARKAIEFISERVHISGLTEKMEEWFNTNKI